MTQVILEDIIFTDNITGNFNLRGLSNTKKLVKHILRMTVNKSLQLADMSSTRWENASP